MHSARGLLEDGTCPALPSVDRGPDLCRARGQGFPRRGGVEPPVARGAPGKRRVVAARRWSSDGGGQVGVVEHHRLGGGARGILGVRPPYPLRRPGRRPGRTDIGRLFGAAPPVRGRHRRRRCARSAPAATRGCREPEAADRPFDHATRRAMARRAQRFAGRGDPDRDRPSTARLERLAGKGWLTRCVRACRCHAVRTA